MQHIKKIIGVASGKGGVGKSMVALNLALALLARKHAVGLLDADIYGPSQPTMLDAVGKRPALQAGGLQPINRWGLQTMSMGYLVDVEAPMIWRGPMIGKALQQLFSDTLWGELDYLVIDLPPGTGDVQLTLCQKIPVSGIVIVTTPQAVALADVTRACEMFRKLNVPLLGIVENMGVYRCEHCGHDAHPFGSGGGATLAEQYQLEVLAKIPLDAAVSTMMDYGNPPMIAAPEGDFAKKFDAMAKKIIEMF